MNDKEKIEKAYNHISESVSKFILPIVSCNKGVAECVSAMKRIRDYKNESSSYDNFVLGVTEFMEQQIVGMAHSTSLIVLKNIQRYAVEAFKE